MATPESTTPLKNCTKCKQTFPATTEYFMQHKGGLYSQCHDCRREAKRASHVRNREHNNARTRAWIELHREELNIAQKERYRADEVYAESVRARARAWKENNLERNRQRAREWYWSHPERARAAARDWAVRNADKVRASRPSRKARRRSRLVNAPGTFTAADIALQKRAQTDKRGILRCWWCSTPVGDDFHLDHRIALAAGGSNAPDNLCISCPSCNMSKGAKTPWAFNGRLL